MNLNIRWILRGDLEQVAQLEENQIDSMSENDIVEALCKDKIGKVALYGDKVVGHMVYEIKKNKIIVYHLTVDTEYRRKGVATSLIETLLGRNKRVVVSVQEHNLAAQLLLKSLGFWGSNEEQGHIKFVLYPEQESEAIAHSRVNSFAQTS
jgi:ribosomal protein S18 acetylase RimI-like enzyme